MLYLNGGVAPYTWAVTCGDCEIEHQVTEAKSNRLFVGMGQDGNIYISVMDGCGVNINGRINAPTVSCADYDHGKTIEENGGTNELGETLALFFRPEPLRTQYTIEDFDFLDDGLSEEDCKGEIKFVSIEPPYVKAHYYRADPRECIDDICDEGEIEPVICGHKFIYEQEAYSANLVVSATGAAFTPGVDTEAVVTALFGRGRITWSLEGDGSGFSLGVSDTAENILYISGEACGSKAIVAWDECGNTGRTIVRSTDGYWYQLANGFDCGCYCTGLTDYISGPFNEILCNSDTYYVKVQEYMYNTYTDIVQQCLPSGQKPCDTWECSPVLVGCGANSGFLPCILDLRPCEPPKAWTVNWASCCYNYTIEGDCPDENDILWEARRSCRTYERNQYLWRCSE
jgi:hypothetical protein